MRWLVTLLALLPLQVAALSCVEPTVKRAYHSVADAVPAYVIVSGTLEFDHSDWPDRSSEGDELPTAFIPARVSGMSLSSSGFNTPFNAPVTLVSYCLGQWCGSVFNDRDHLMFLRLTDQGYEQDVDPCASKIFLDPTPAQLKTARRCFNGRPCPVQGLLETYFGSDE